MRRGRPRTGAPSPGVNGLTSGLLVRVRLLCSGLNQVVGGQTSLELSPASPRPGLGVLPGVTSQVKVVCDSLVLLRNVLSRDQGPLPWELGV